MSGTGAGNNAGRRQSLFDRYQEHGRQVIRRPRIMEPRRVIRRPGILESDQDTMACFRDGDPDGLGLASVDIETLKHLELMHASLVSREKQKKQVVVNLPVGQEGAWDFLPEEILWNILMRLPVATQCRLRCVCSRWKLILLAPSFKEKQHLSRAKLRPSCSMMFKRGDSVAWFFCHEEEKWFRIPFQPRACLDLDWKLAAASGGLLCYESQVGEKLWMLICNPITGSFQVLPPNYLNLTSRPFTFAKFVVDPKSGTFKVVLMNPKAQALVIFDSELQEYVPFHSRMSSFTVTRMGFRTLSQPFFVYKNVLYQRVDVNEYFTVSMESGRAETMEIDLPCDSQDVRHIRTSGDEVMLEDTFAWEEALLTFWMLDDAASTPNLSTAKWEKVTLGLPFFMRPLISKNLKISLFHGNESICLTSEYSRFWIKYTFRTKAWRVMPRCGRLTPQRLDFYKWFIWEPSLDLEVKSVDFKANDYPELIELLKKRNDPNFREKVDGRASVKRVTAGRW